MALCLDFSIAEKKRDGPFDFYDETFNLAPTIRSSHSHSKLGGRRTTENLTNLFGIAYCWQKMMPYTKHGHLSTDDRLPQTSSCPWYWQLSYDETRIPSILLTAKCSCPTCLGPHSSGASCKPVHYFRKVKYINADTNTTEDSLYRVAVGCTCERRREKN
ncbi:hypothetical protein BaRGS_00020964 [Batillaria attramentaria]|uniref:Uncharacterized protein n=1 Tax=Batillaria attramentaria TaxID=370345 RepID=A0ABD0KKS5_9CAEN